MVLVICSELSFLTLLGTVKIYNKSCMIRKTHLNNKYILTIKLEKVISGRWRTNTCWGDSLIKQILIVAWIDSLQNCGVRPSEYISELWPWYQKCCQATFTFCEFSSASCPGPVMCCIQPSNLCNQRLILVLKLPYCYILGANLISDMADVS